MIAADCSCGHGDLAAHFHMTPCPVKVRHLRDLRTVGGGVVSGGAIPVFVLGYVVVVGTDEGIRSYGDGIYETRTEAESVREEAERMGMDEPDIYMLIPPDAIPMWGDR